MMMEQGKHRGGCFHTPYIIELSDQPVMLGKQHHHQQHSCFMEQKTEHQRSHPAENWLRFESSSDSVSPMYCSISLSPHECPISCSSFSRMGRVHNPKNTLSAHQNGHFPSAFFSLSLYLHLWLTDQCVFQEDKFSFRSSDMDASSWEKSLQCPSWTQLDRSRQSCALPLPQPSKMRLQKAEPAVAEERGFTARGNHLLSHLQLKSGKWWGNMKGIYFLRMLS